jgi:hypothetical protein
VHWVYVCGDKKIGCLILCQRIDSLLLGTYKQSC